ncbi:hypothetical protein GCM10023083_85860 [Streptomyces phyllanthi]
MPLVGLAQQPVHGPPEEKGECDRATDDNQGAEQILHAFERNQPRRVMNM